MSTTVISGPPERSRTRSPLRNGEAVRSCVAAFSGADSEKAGTDKGGLSEIPSVTAIAIEPCFAGGNILNSILSRGMDQHVGKRARRKWVKVVSAICEWLEVPLLERPIASGYGLVAAGHLGLDRPFSAAIA